MRFLYSLAYTIAFLTALPYFLVTGLLHGKYLSSVKQRFGWIPLSSELPSIWVHAVSVGEFLGAKPLVRRILEEFPEVPLFVSTTTVTGQTLARKMLPGTSFYFPFDWNWCIRKVLHRIRPCLILVMETEIWPNFLWETKKQGVPVILVNGRISDRSHSRYRLLRRWLPQFEECLMQSDQDATRMRALGTARERIHVMGNLKFDFQPHLLPPDLRRLLMQWKGSSLLWVAGSTMESEEESILEAFLRLRDTYDVKLLLAPRHPERFATVANLIARRNLPYARRSDGGAVDQPVLLLDSIGELAATYELADFVLIGGTVRNYGGHNLIEPAYFGKAILSGPYYANFQAIFEEFRRRGAVLITKDLYTDMTSLLRDPHRGKMMGSAAQALVKENSGATELVLKRVRQRLHDRSRLESDQKLLVR